MNLYQSPRLTGFTQAMAGVGWFPADGEQKISPLSTPADVAALVVERLPPSVQKLCVFGLYCTWKCEVL